MGITVTASLDDALSQPTDVLVDYTSSDSVKPRVLAALAKGVRVVIGTSGLTAQDYQEIADSARRNGVGVIAGGNFSLTAALAKHFALFAAHHLPSWEIIDYAHADKPDAPQRWRCRTSWPKISARFSAHCGTENGRCLPRLPASAEGPSGRLMQFTSRVFAMYWFSLKSLATCLNFRMARDTAKIARLLPLVSAIA